MVIDDAKADRMQMTRQTHIIQPIPRLPVSRRGHKRIILSAILYIMACVWLGPDAAFWLTVIGAWTLFWFWLCGRYSWVGAFTSAFLVGFVGGLFGYRNTYVYRPRYRRW